VLINWLRPDPRFFGAAREGKKLRGARESEDTSPFVQQGRV